MKAARTESEASAALVGADPASSSLDTSTADSTDEQDLHAVDTVLLATARARWDERPTADDETRIDQRAFESETALHVREVPATETSTSGEITAETLRGGASNPPLVVEPGSNPEPTVATRLDPGVTNLVPGTFVGEIMIEGLLGSGAMGQVYAGRHEHLGKRVALKVITPGLSRDRGAIERFEQEAIALARLSHPNIVGVLGVGALPGDGRSYYLMEYLDGEALQTRIDRDRLPIDLALEVMGQIARGLEAAHGAGIVHRDLKPDNIWLQRVGDEPQPVVRILDLGLSKLTEHRRSEETATGVLFGTPQFMSPEQCESARDVGPATDVYALGAIAYELFCGRLPFLYDNGAELIVAHQTEAPPRPRDLTPTLDSRLDGLLLAMLAKDLTQRPTLAVVRSTIATVQSESRAAKMAPRMLIAPSAPKWRLRRGAVVTALVVLALVSVLVASSLTRRDDRVAEQARGIDASVVHESPAPPSGVSVPPAASVGNADIPSRIPPADATATASAVPTPIVRVERRGDAGARVPRVAGDAGISGSIEAAVDARPPDDEPARASNQATTTPTQRPEPQPVNTRPRRSIDQKPIGAKPGPSDQGQSDRDRTFDPFRNPSP